MTQRITVLPAEGRTVPDPEAGDLLPAEGRVVTFNAWWQRRHNDGDITLQTEQLPTQSAETA
ncbi:MULTISPECIES: DUF2635 domain-containing protein [Pseudomonas syringae group]|uniref:DUF2635 domain-containing protein n=1 Tax=Pseudomonas syringae group TaxID=136849 RepID=UPI0005B6D63D|nr:DUF2635 domain-containing protein [Pseudomonas viridiflava]MBD8805400.1 DUF2635 domain-containing protein [Pseudomonas syringae]KIQ32241.1 hypothetical protein RT94_16260 [Pseudomonas viridiflava]MEE4126903.1 DUF2635 domain-containing protein [Pseudomonas viridiflava]MEE4229109.1 DUF2635 domain-containing protein [Pseudomonas viridiflava]MEE4232961.1 DUF2635 domain-containing protein [Pseudomonas viridiflava]